MTSKAITTTATTALRIGLFGGGIVGGGVIELLQKYNQRTSTELGLSIEVVKICVRSLEKPRDFKYDSNAIKLVTNRYQKYFYNSCWVKMNKPPGAERMENSAYW